MARSVLANADAARVVAVGAKRRSPARPHPLRTALVALLLFFEPLLERLHELLEASHLLDKPLLLFGEVLAADGLQPVLVDLSQGILDRLGPLHPRGEDAVEAIDVSLVRT